MVNYFTKTLKGGVYVPAELAVCKFSLKEGVSRVYQTLINPGKFFLLAPSVFELDSLFRDMPLQVSTSTDTNMKLNIIRKQLTICLCLPTLWVTRISPIFITKF